MRVGCRTGVRILRLPPLHRVSVYGVAIGAQYAALGNFCQDSFDPVSATLDHIGQVNQLARARPIFGRRVYVVKLESRRYARVPLACVRLAPACQFDLVNNFPRNILGNNSP